jgi:hypothetical protein
MLARIPFPLRDVVHQRQPLIHEAQQLVEASRFAPRRDRRVRGSAAARRQRHHQQAYDTHAKRWEKKMFSH